MNVLDKRAAIRAVAIALGSVRRELVQLEVEIGITRRELSRMLENVTLDDYLRDYEVRRLRERLIMCRHRAGVLRFSIRHLKACVRSFNRELNKEVLKKS